MKSSQSTFSFPEVRVVEASAGSGKTFALAKRYVQLVLDPRASSHGLPIRTILAITFMKKASFEMKQRILAFLKAIALKTMPQDQVKDILDPIGIDLNKASLRAFDVMDELIHHYNFFQVQTIDSFINALLSGCAFKIGLSSRFRIKHNPFDYLAYSLDRLIEHAAHNPDTAKLFADFLDQYLLLENKGSWFPKKDILGLLNALYHQRNSYGMEFVLHTSEDSLFVQMSGIMDLMRKLKDCLPEKTHATFRKSLDKFCERYNTAFDFDALSNYFHHENFPMTGGKEVPGEVSDLWDEIRERIRRLAESEAYLLFSPYVAVFEKLLKEFQAKAQKDDVLFMEELNRKARLLFDEGHVTVEELYYRLAARLRHYMIDEFQDTSILQFENLVMMIEEALSTGGSLFYVGDKKQAIYGFRGGEVALFDQLKQTFKHFNVNVERLGKNYRSYEAIVNFNNQLFDMDNLDRFIAQREQEESEKKNKHNAFVFNDEDKLRLKRTFDQCAQSVRDDHKGGYVRVERICGAKRQERDDLTRQKVLELIQNLHTRFCWKDMAVLTRKNAEVEQVTAWLMEAGIPVKSERTLNITENKLVQDLVAFLTFLNSPIDDLAFAQVILSDVFCKASGLEQKDMHAFLFELRKRGKKEGAALYREFRKQYTEEWDAHIAPFFRSTGFYPLYELFISILKEWQVLENFEDQCGFVMKLLEVIKKREEDGCDVVSFLEYFDNLRNEDAFVNVTQLDSVEILTTHKAKGLEFKVVVLPFAAMEIQVGSRGGAPGEELGQRSYLMNNANGKMELLRIKSEYLPYSDHLYQIYRAQAVESLFSELNNIYVSFTRAQKEMYVFVPEKTGTGANILNLLIPEDLTAFGNLSKKLNRSEEVKGSDEVVILPTSSYRDWIAYLNEEFLNERSALINREKLKRGREFHELLSKVGNLKKDDGAGLAEIEEVVNKEELRFLFYTDGEVFTEKEIVDKCGRTKRIDRLIVTEKDAIIADYKSARIDGDHYYEQVKEYMDVVAQMYPEKNVKGFLVYLDDLSLEKII